MDDNKVVTIGIICATILLLVYIIQEGYTNREVEKTKQLRLTHMSIDSTTIKK